MRSPRWGHDFGLAKRGDNFQLKPGVEKVALAKDLRSGWAATFWPPHNSPRATRAVLCRRAQNWGPSTGRGGLPSRVTSALGLGHQTPAVTQEGKAPPQPGREPGSARRSAARSPPSHRGAPGCPAPSALCKRPWGEQSSRECSGRRGLPATRGTSAQSPSRQA